MADEVIGIDGAGVRATIFVWKADFVSNARIERIWDGTSEIQRHIISRSLLRPLGA